MSKLSERLKELRGPSSQKEMAEAVGIKWNAWARYERGEVSPGAEILAQICIAHACSADWLLGLTDTQQPKKSSVSVVNSGGSAIAIGNGATAGRDCMECPLLQAHLKRFSKPSK